MTKPMTEMRMEIGTENSVIGFQAHIESNSKDSPIHGQSMVNLKEWPFYKSGAVNPLQNNHHLDYPFLCRPGKKKKKNISGVTCPNRREECEMNGQNLF
jgi:hypothetical protein